MRLLLDTHVLLWATSDAARLPGTARDLIVDPDNVLLFSAASLWEIAIKQAQGRADFPDDARVLRRELLDNDYEELGISGDHAVAVCNLPSIHKDPFDRILIAQAIVEGVTLLTADAQIAKYPGPIRKV